MSARRQELEEGERRHFGFRVTPAMKAHIEAAAKASGRSMSQEVELRLEQSKDRLDLLPDALRLAFGELGGIVLLVAVAMAREGRKATWDATGDPDAWQGDTWLAHPAGYAAAQRAAHDVIDLAAPPDTIMSHFPTPDIIRQYDRAPPSGVARMIEASLKTTTTNAPLAYSVEIRKLLSATTLKRILKNVKQTLGGSASE